MPTERPPLLGEVVPTFADRGCCVVSATDSPGRIFGFLDRSQHFLILNYSKRELHSFSLQETKKNLPQINNFGSISVNYSQRDSL
jgi:hypothetical protein